jgi:hypothetical protein
MNYPGVRMSRMTSKNENRILSKTLTLLGLGLAFGFGALSVSAQQNQSGDVQATIEQQNPQDQAPPYQTAPNDAMAPQAAPNQVAPNQAPPPATLTLPAGTIIRVRVDEWLSSDRNLPGDIFSAVLDQPIVVDGWVIARRGQAESGKVAVAKKSGQGSASSQLGVQLSDLTLVDGQQLPLQTEMQQTSAGSKSSGRDAAVIGTTTGVGAAIGAVADGGPGAAVGAGLGVVAGIAGVMATRGRPTVIPPETVLSFRLQAPVTISTERSQFAFQPVTQDDYNAGTPNLRPRRFAGPGGPGYPPPYYGYPYAYPYPYAFFPGPFGFGFYGGYGFGPRFGFGRFRR